MFSNWSWLSFIVGLLFGTFVLPMVMGKLGGGGATPVKRSA